MTGKEKFIKVIEETLNTCPDFFGELGSEEATAAIEYFQTLTKTNEVKPLSEKAQAIYNYMVSNAEKCNNIFTAKSIAEGLEISAKSVSGSMRKLVTDGYVTKSGKDPVTYSL